MFELVAILAALGLIGGIALDDETFRFLNTLANMLTVTLLVIHQRHVRNTLEPKVERIDAVTRRQLGEREPAPDAGDRVPWDGHERRGTGKAP